MKPKISIPPDLSKKLGELSLNLSIVQAQLTAGALSAIHADLAFGEPTGSDLIRMTAEKIEKLKTMGMEGPVMEKMIREYLTDLTKPDRSETAMLYPWRVWDIKA